VFTLAFAGDVHFSGRVRKRLAHPATAFGPAANVLRRADLTMVNLETAITTGGIAQAKEFHFRAPPVALTALRDAGIDVATEANNHGADYGLPGLHDTLRAIRHSHFPVIGIGRNADQAFAPYRTTINGTKIAIFAADQVQDETTLRLFSAGPHKPGVANAYYPRLIRAVRRAHRAGYLVLAYIHWGIEYDTCPSSDQETLARQLARAGAAAVIGTHVHVLQGDGWLPNGTFVAYGLGNYLWWESFHNIQDDNGVLFLNFRAGKVVGAHFAPAHLDSRGIPMPAHGTQRRRILAQLAHDRSCTNLPARPAR
jgi:poly-gamma-glutamate synthesis protein (capsule biosynthesis protein)